MYDGGQVAAAAVFHGNVEHANIAIDVTVVVSNHVVMMEDFQDVPGNE